MAQPNERVMTTKLLNARKNRSQKRGNKAPTEQKLSLKVSKFKTKVDSNLCPLYALAELALCYISAKYGVNVQSIKDGHSRSNATKKKKVYFAVKLPLTIQIGCRIKQGMFGLAH